MISGEKGRCEGTPHRAEADDGDGLEPVDGGDVGDSAILHRCRPFDKYRLSGSYSPRGNYRKEPRSAGGYVAGHADRAVGFLRPRFTTILLMCLSPQSPSGRRATFNERPSRVSE